MAGTWAVLQGDRERAAAGAGPSPSVAGGACCGGDAAARACEGGAAAVPAGGVEKGVPAAPPPPSHECAFWWLLRDIAQRELEGLAAASAAAATPFQLGGAGAAVDAARALAKAWRLARIAPILRDMAGLAWPEDAVCGGAAELAALSEEAVSACVQAWAPRLEATYPQGLNVTRS